MFDKVTINWIFLQISHISLNVKFRIIELINCHEKLLKTRSQLIRQKLRYLQNHEKIKNNNKTKVNVKAI